VTEYRTLSIDALLGRVALARRRGDVMQAKAEWDACVFRGTPRARAAVRAFMTKSGDRVPAHDHDSVVYEALERACRRMIHTLDSLDERAFAAAIVTCAINSCHDYFRREGQCARGIRGSLDEPAFDDGEGARFDSDIAREAELQLADDEAAFEASDCLARAMRRMRHTRRRQAVELREQGFDYDEVATALGTSVGNAQQLYSRGLKDIRGLLEP
jgi:RNA polymerase sigma factor (sigma-70 family)